MNQGNVGRFVKDDGVFQDGGLLIHFPDQHEWAAVFLKFQSQAGTRRHHRAHHPGPAPAQPAPAPPPATGSTHHQRSPWPGTHRGGTRRPDGVAGGGGCHAAEHRATRRRPRRAGDARYPEEAVAPLGGALARRCAARSCASSQPFALSNKGGLITLLDDKGLKVHGVSYTKEQARDPGWTIVF